MYDVCKCMLRHPQNVTVWCALWVEEIFVVYFLKNYAGHNVKDDGEC